MVKSVSYGGVPKQIAAAEVVDPKVRWNVWCASARATEVDFRHASSNRGRNCVRSADVIRSLTAIRSPLAQCLETDPNASVYHAAVEGSPGIDGPSAVRGLLRTHQRIPSRLPDAAEVLRVDEQSHAAEASLDKSAEQHVRVRSAIEMGSPRGADCP